MKASSASVLLPRARYESPSRKAARTARGWRRERRQEPPEGRDALVQAGVVGRIGDAEGRGDLVEGVGTDGGEVALLASAG